MNCLRYDYDVVQLSDLRYPGGNSASLAEEVKAQARAGYSTGLMHVPAPHMSRNRMFNRRIMHCLSGGLAELVPTDRPVRARALVVRQPRLFTEDPGVRPRVEADAGVFVVNHPPHDGLHGPDHPYYDVTDVRDRVRSLFGDIPWAPIGPSVRNRVLESGVALDLRGEDWVNVLDVDEWRVARSGPRADRPVIGRHSRDHRTKWPDKPSDILAVYPAGSDYDVRVLGGADAAIAALGYKPSNWTVYPFGAMRPERFLREVDFYVYYHHPGWVESFGRNIIEGMASGCPAILPRQFELLFGDHCFYAAPAEVQGLVDDLHARPAQYDEWSAKSVAFVESRFGAAAHVRRVRELVGDSGPGVGNGPVAGASLARTLLVSTAGTGLGSVTRVLRVAARLPGGVSPILLAPWSAADLGREAEILTEVIPDDELKPGGLVALVERVRAIADVHGVDSVLVDASRDVALEIAAAVDLPSVALGIPPSESGGNARLAAIVELGDAALQAPDYSRPIEVLQPADDPLPREQARSHLEMTGGGPLALLCAGSDGRAIQTSRLGLIADALTEHGWSVVFAEPVVGSAEIRLPQAVRRLSLRPLPRFLNAFDAAVAVGGHTLTHELLAARCPMLLAPIGGSPADAQRASYADGQGLALALGEFSERALDASVGQVTDEAVRRRLVAAMSAIELRDAAPHVAGELLRLSGHPVGLPR